MKKRFLAIFFMLMFLLSATLPTSSSYSINKKTLKIINPVNPIKVDNIIRDDDGTREDSVDLDDSYDRAVKYIVIPPEISSRIKSAKIYIFGQAFGQISTGNSHEIMVNGAWMEFNSYDYFKSENFGWGYIKVIQPWIFKSGVNTIEIRQISGKNSDKYLRIGIDTDNDFDRSKWWDRESASELEPTPEDCNGELMIYLELSLIRNRSNFFSNFLEIFPVLNQLYQIIIE